MRLGRLDRTFSFPKLTVMTAVGHTGHSPEYQEGWEIEEMDRNGITNNQAFCDEFTTGPLVTCHSKLHSWWNHVSQGACSTLRRLNHRYGDGCESVGCARTAVCGKGHGVARDG